MKNYLVYYNDTECVVRAYAIGHEYRAVVVAANKRELLNQRLYLLKRQLFMEVCPDYMGKLKFQAYA